MVVWTDAREWSGALDPLRAARPGIEERDEIAPGEELHLVIQLGRLFQQEHPEVRVIADRGRFLVVALDPQTARRLPERDEVCYGVFPLPVDTVIFRSVAPSARAPEAWVQQLVDAVSATTYEATIRRLAELPTRHSLSAHFATAANSARHELEQLGYSARLENISIKSGTSHNVVGDRQGGGNAPRDLVIVGAHLDSINLRGGTQARAPGADDNGSGAAGLLEIARVLAGHEAEHDLRLILFGGEEQGLFGSTQHVTRLSPEDRERATTVVNMDMIATLNTAAPTVLLEGAALSQQLIDRLAEAAATYTSLAVQTSLHPFNSDHVPFIDAAIPAVLTIEGADSANDSIHTGDDTMDRVDIDLALEIVRMNVASAASALGRVRATCPLSARQQQPPSGAWAAKPVPPTNRGLCGRIAGSRTATLRGSL